ncbi:MAG: hypothetical protein KF691_10130 [Phycisphaeraceae bacterium]|nr:hypothetical protein [Phycisphaeraceae bacterium]
MNCELTGNKAGKGDTSTAPPGRDGIGGAICAIGDNSIDNCTIAGNMARGQGAGIYKANLSNSIVFFNQSESLGQSLDAQVVGGIAVYYDVQGWIPSISDPILQNSNVDPEFADILGPDGIPGTLDDNSRLTQGSPAIDSANGTRLFADLIHYGLLEFLNVDLDDRIRVVDDPNVPNASFGPPLDRGAYEFWPFICTGDLNVDGQVDDADFAVFVAAYNLLDCTALSMPAGCPADFNHDSVVEDADFVIFVGAYNELICP